VVNLVDSSLHQKTTRSLGFFTEHGYMSALFSELFFWLGWGWQRAYTQWLPVC